MTVYDPVIGGSISGGATVVPTYPAVSAQNSGGIGDKFILVVAYGNSAGATPATPAGWTLIDSSYGGAGTWGLETGPRGVVMFHQTSVGGEAGTTVTVNNGGTGTDRTMRGVIYRFSKSGSTWEAITSAKGTDTSAGTAFSVATGSNPGASLGDQILGVAGYTPSTSTASGTSGFFNWTGAGVTGTLGATAPAANGNALRMQSYYGTPSGTATGNLTLQLTMSSALTSGAAMAIRLRDSGQPPVANAGNDIDNAEPGSTVFLDATESVGNIATYHWAQTGGPTVTLSNSTTVGPSFTAPWVTAGTTLTFSLYVTDTTAVNSNNTDTVIVTVLPPTEFADDGGTLVPLQLLGE